MLAQAFTAGKWVGGAHFESFAPVAQDDVRPYRLEVRDADGVILKVLDKWHTALWEQKVNAPDELTLSYPAQESKASAIDYPNFVWLKENQD